MKANQGYRNIYEATCIRDGKVIWKETVKNLVVVEGLNHSLQMYFKGVNYTASHFVGLKGAGPVVDSDTLAVHPGWDELINYPGDRQPLVLSDAFQGSVTNALNRAVFDITIAGVAAGIFVSNTDSGTNGILFGAVDFGAERYLIPADQLIITCTFTQASI